MPTTGWELALMTLLAIGLSMFVLWVASLARRDVSFIDICWGLGFAFVAVGVGTQQAGLSGRSQLVIVLTVIWALRLSGYLLWRNWGEPEDRRYAAMRASYGQRFWWVSLVIVFGLQGLLMWWISLPIQFGVMSNEPTAWSVLDGLGVGLWSVGILFETVGDWQLARFRANPANRGRVLDQGLWRYTRHPNYFGDFCVWWGLYLLAAAGGAAWTIGSPIVMTVLLLRVSGVTLLEQTITERRPEYAAYIARTNAFFPGPVKASSIP